MKMSRLYKYKPISKFDFRVKHAGYGHYKFMYTSPYTFTCWIATLASPGDYDMLQNDEEGYKRSDLIRLKNLIKKYGRKYTNKEQQEYKEKHYKDVWSNQ